MAIPFKLGMFSIAGEPPFAGVVLDDSMVAVSALQPLCEALNEPLHGAETVFGLLQSWERNFSALQHVIQEIQVGTKHYVPFVALNAFKVHAPVMWPRQIFCAGANYRQHVIDLAVAQGHGPNDTTSHDERRKVAERTMDERIANGIPYVFTKLPTAITGPYDLIILPSDVKQPDWELELAVVIGSAARHVARADALQYVAGYTMVNDITSRDKIYRADMKAIGTDWLAGKSSPTFLPMGPYLVPASFIPDPQQLHLTLKVNDQIMQDEGTDDMIFGVARLIEYLSSMVLLLPGDILCTGSPRGNGMHFGRFLQPDDVMEATISEIGTQRNVCVAEK